MCFLTAVESAVSQLAVAALQLLLQQVLILVKQFIILLLLFNDAAKIFPPSVSF